MQSLKNRKSMEISIKFHYILYIDEKMVQGS